MTRIIRLGGFALTGALVALSWVSEPAVAETPSAAASWETMTQCAGIADADVRHACTDEVLRKAGLLTSTPSSVQSQAKPAAQPSSPVSAQSSPQPPVQSSSTPPAPPAKTAALPAPAPQASFGQDRTREEPDPDSQKKRRPQCPRPRDQPASRGRS